MNVKNMLRPGADAAPRALLLHRVWMIFGITGMGCCVGLVSLLAAAFSYGKLNGYAIFASYFMHPLIALLNLSVSVGLMWLFYFLTGRAWGGFLGSYLPTMGLTLVNYYKIRLRSDPLLAADLRLAAEAKGIMGGYTLDFTWVIGVTLLCFAAGLLGSILLLPGRWRDRGGRLFGLISAACLLAVAFWGQYTNPRTYAATANDRFINPWSDVEVYASKGCLYPFLYSVRDMFPTPPEGYDRQQAAALLGEYPDADIPEGRKVHVVGVMLEAFADLTDIPSLAAQPGVAQVYEPWHELTAQGVSGRLLTNIFAGGTVDTEWGFLTGCSQHQEFRKNTDSYVWYLRQQGYDTLYHHPGYGWFYNRQNVNGYLGFARQWFTENHYGALVDPEGAIFRSDDVLVDGILGDLNDRFTEGDWAFSFSVSYQNHGPYGGGGSSAGYLTPEGSGLSADSCDIFNSYLKGVSSTIAEMKRLKEALEGSPEPVVLVLFGDHKPWGGNGNSAYHEAGADFSLTTLDSFYQYYATPYLIWANPAAREKLGGDRTGDGGDFSPCFLMDKVFDLCQWDGPGFMQLGRQMRAVTPLLHVRGLYLDNGALTDALPGDAGEFLKKYLWAQYYREQEIVPGA